MKLRFFASISLVLVLTLQAVASDGFKPEIKVNGSFLGRYEYSSDTEASRFSVRSSRVGVNATVSETFNFIGQVELSDNGGFKMLDLYGDFKPTKALSFTMGQRTIPLFNGYTVVPSQLMFANRPLLGKYLMGTRDIGFLAEYEFGVNNFPIGIEAGVYNGGTINSPTWHTKPSFGGRVSFGKMEGWRSTLKLYNHNSAVNSSLSMGVDLRYQAKNWKAESEFMSYSGTDGFNDERKAFYLQGAYGFPIKSNKAFKSFVPALRFDGFTQNLDTQNWQYINRLTTGLGFGLNDKLFESILRFDYELMFYDQYFQAQNFQRNNTAGLFTVELVLMF